MFRSRSSWLFNVRHLERAQEFYEKYGPKTIILARFVPIVRTFAPFVAGIGKMSYGKFALYRLRFPETRGSSRPGGLRNR